MTGDNNSNDDDNNNTVENQFEDILSLVIARSRGEVGNDAVENALSSIVVVPKTSQNNGAAAETTSRATTKGLPNRHGVIQDTDNYDFDEDDNDDCGDGGGTKPTASVQPPKIPQTAAAAHAPSKSTATTIPQQRYDESIQDIPLGKMGSRMLITFGDGPQPRPEVVEAALLGARSSLQRAVLDARALYRRLKDQFNHARAAVLQPVKTTDAKRTLQKFKGVVSASDLVVDNELSFRALEASGERNIPCGFDVKALEILFPEEMNAYRRWKTMHDAYTENSSNEIKSTSFTDDDNELKSNANNPDTNNNTDDDNNNNNIPVESSRLYQRLCNFDVRTHHMNSNSYIQFADVRKKGSFLKQSLNTNNAKEWAKTNMTREKGRPSGRHRSTWTNLHPSSVVFLHWVGFDPLSALPPPDEEITQALGFLAHDFLGKIVEKAVVIHLQGSKVKTRFKKGSLPELSGSDQLDVTDIQKAIQETSLKSLYSSSDSGGGDIGHSSQVAQLYFGPGFEDRLELELEEIFGAKNKRLTAEELKIRQEEEALFSGITGPPPTLDNLTNNISADASSPAKKRQRTVRRDTAS